MARQRKGRDISGWLIIDKPVGITSAALVNKAKWALGAKKAGHAGTLDPEATGLLALAFGEATKTVLNDDGYESRYNIKNPNHDLIIALKEAGVKLTVCGQSLVGRKIDPDEVNENIELATSMLTTVTTYQLKGYTLLKF